MDIKSLNPSLVNSRGNDAVRNQERNAGGLNNPTSNTAKSADKVTLTNVSSQAKDLEAKAADSKIDQSARIEAIKAAIKDGSYQINAQNIASKLIQTESMLAGA
jgi:negative regulator of flagellin synthesis FlgM